MILNAIQAIYDKYPSIKNKIENPQDPTILLTTQEAVFLQLALFFEQPDLRQFSINMIYEHLKDEDLLFALQCLITYFQKDTSLVQSVPQTFYDRSLLREQIVGQKKFSEMVEDAIQGMKFRPSMLSMLWKRRSERIPRPDLIIDGTPYWLVSSVHCFIEKEKKNRSDKEKKKQAKK